jgi:NADPH:quinone reductase-like Zn-dependent oxidoreductase/acyl carrier protein
VYLWALDERLEEALPGGALWESQERACGSAMLLTQALVNLESEAIPHLWLVTERAQPTGREGKEILLAQSTIVGMAKVIALEHPELRCRLVDLDSVDRQEDNTLLIDELTGNGGESQVVYREGTRFVPKVIRYDEKRRVDIDCRSLPEDKAFQLVIEEKGTLDGLHIRPVERIEPKAHQVEIRVRSTGLNFRDVISALGMISNEAPPGLECSGTVVRVGASVKNPSIGDEVIALASGTFATFATANAALVMPKPEFMTFEEAATIPLAFLTAHYGLCHLAGMAKGDKVLIHAASGGVGQAAVQLAKTCGAEVFGTAGNTRKREFLKSVGVDHCLDSRSLDFADQVLSITGGEGIDIVLNSLSDAFIPRSFSILRKGGRFIEIGKRGIWTKEQAAGHRPDVFYEAFDLASVMADEPEILRPMLSELMEKFSSGTLAPLPLVALPMEQVVTAYRTMQQARHIGKIVITQQPWSSGNSIEKPDAFSAHDTYLITGGFGGIGLRLIQWLLERGARHFAIVGRHEPLDEIKSSLAELEKGGARCRQIHCDVSSDSEVRRLFEEILQGLPRLRGIFHLAGVIDDGALMHQDWRRFGKVLGPKVLGAWNLHRHSIGIPLDCFVMFSSWASFLGSPGQVNYTAANAFMDALAWKRRAMGLPALSVNWAAWGEIGLATKCDRIDRLNRRGIGSFSPKAGFRALGRLMSQGVPEVAVIPFDLKRWRASNPTAAESRWFEFIDDQAAVGGGNTAESPVTLKEALISAKPGPSRRLVLETHLKELLSQTLRLPVSRIDSDRAFKSYGMDSLTALEFRNRIESSIQVTLSVSLVFNYPNISRLTPYLFEKMGLPMDGAETVKTCQSRSAGLDSSDLYSDDEALRALLEKVESLTEEEARELLDDEH